MISTAFGVFLGIPVGRRAGYFASVSLNREIKTQTQKSFREVSESA
jgi:hypothetical protein